MSIRNEYGLTPKQEAFAQAFIDLGVASHAYKKAYNTENMEYTTIKREAHELVKHPAVSARIKMLRDEAKEDIQITREMIASKMYDIMSNTKDEKTAIKAGESLSKLMGLNEPDKLDFNGGGFNINIIKPFQEPTT